ncbi:MAG: RsmB/NOP family class I SAM-dependent RNA methyltransferase [Lentisphaeria bacterium]
MTEKKRTEYLVLQFCTSYLERWGKGLNPDLENAPVSAKRICKDLLSNYFRYRGFIQAYIKKLTDNRVLDESVRLVLECGMTQLIFQEGISAEHAVNAIVEFIKKKNKKASGFVNAVFRNFLRKDARGLKSDRQGGIKRSFGSKYNELFLGQKLYQEWRSRYNDSEFLELIEVLEAEPEITVRQRKNVVCEKVPDYLEELALDFDAGVEKFYRCIDAERFFKEGGLAHFYVQDAATAVAANMVGCEGSDLVIGDFCAAPGGKSVIIAENLGSNGKLYACDVNLSRIEQLEENLGGFENVEIKQQDALKVIFEEGTFDCILLDLPCSNSGVIRKNPDVKWRYNKRMVRELSQLQRKIVEQALPLLKRGGKIVYSTCSIDQVENSQQVANLLASYPELELVKEQQIMPNLAHDGAYAALLQRRV